MKKIAFLAILLFSFACLNPPAALTAVPHLLTYQGILKDSTGNYLTGTYSMVFKIYNTSTGGTALWTETQSSVSAASGRFSVQLGSVTALNLSFAADYWLGITVGADSEMTPRQRLTAVGYAYQADNVVNGFTQPQHDALSHMSVDGVKSAHMNIAKTNFKLDAYSSAAANGMGDLILDVFSDASGIDAAGSNQYERRGSPNYDIVSFANPFQQVAGPAAWNDHLRKTSDHMEVAQSFVPSQNMTVGRVDLHLKKWGNPPATTWAEIYTDSSGNPGSIVGSASGTVNNSTLTGTNAWISFSFTSNYPSLTANTTYWIVFKGDFAVDPNNAVFFNVSDQNPYAGGQLKFKSQTSGWYSGNASWDMLFKIYRQYTGSGEATVKSIGFAEAAVPAEAMVVADETLNAGSITYYVSRDNGTTWAVSPKDTVVNISSQPSGTQLRWKAVITGDAELNAVAVVV